MIGLNVLGLPAPDVTGLIDWLIAAKPPYTLVMDNPDIATRAAMTGTRGELEREVTDLRRRVAFLEGENSALDKLLKKLEVKPPPPDDDPDPPPTPPSEPHVMPRVTHAQDVKKEDAA